MKPCNSCGKCCIHYADGGLSATSSEIQLWKDEYPNIYSFVHNQQIWCDPVTGKALVRCPWLIQAQNTDKYHCSIYLQRPEDCKLYPAILSDMIEDHCEMLEPKDYKDRNQANIALKNLMSESWDY